MHFELKSISEESIPEALAKVERYRLLTSLRLLRAFALMCSLSIPISHRR